MNTLNIKIEKVFNPDETLHGYFVSKTDGKAEENPMMTMFKQMAEAMGENVGEYKKKGKQTTDEKIFCATEKDLKNYIAFLIADFK